MPVHDWSRVEAGIFHHFHHAWIEEIARALNNGVLPDDYAILLLVPPKVRLTAETERGFYRRKQSSVAARHVSGGRVVAMVEVVSPSNKASRHGLRSFVEKGAQFSG